MTQNKLIAFCYFYIVGIVTAMLWPLDPVWLPWLRGGTTFFFVTGIALFVRRPNARWLWAATILPALLLGYTRYTGANTVPDGRVGEIRFTQGERAFHQRAALSDTSRLRIRATSPLSEPVRIRLRGELDARVPVRDEQGLCRMDEQGRWLFNIVRMPIVSDVVTLTEGDGAEAVVHQPFTRITGVDWLDGPDTGVLEVDRLSNHIGSFTRPARSQSPVTILGRITADPRVYDFKTVLMVTPRFVQFPAGGPFYPVEGGDVQVTIQPEMTGYDTFAQTAAYGADVQLSGDLTVARAESNPGGFNARRFMQNYNIYGLMSLYQPPDHDAPIQVIRPENGEARTGNWLTAFSLHLRDRVLLVFKATMPYPQSAFLGGVVLGLRYGLQGTQFPGEEESADWTRWVGLQKSENLIADDFRQAGVNHVLAVSGLHVTILTVMFVGFFSLLRFPRQAYVPFVIFALIVFAIITGARPSTLRAVIMNSLFLMTWAYLGRGLMSSVLLGVPVAALLILLHNPLVAVDPSFTLSFGAILSLALITMPAHEVLSRLRGNRFLVVILFTTATTVVGVVHWALVVTPLFWIPWFALGAGLYAWASAQDRRGHGIPSRFAFTALPEPVSAFLAAQIAIQVGMMIPLSAYYFCRWPFAGAFANLIAIPLIGVVVQLGAIAGLLGLIPGVGPILALVLNAANWIFTSIFLWLAHVFTLVFPYPFVRRPRVIEIVVYYLFLAAWVWRKPLATGVRSLCARAGWRHRRAPLGVACVGLLLLTLPLWLGRAPKPDGLRMTVLSVGYGSSILVETPGGQRVLIDTGFVEHERGRRNEAVRTILPFLSHSTIRRLDALILTSPWPERAAGAAYVLEQMRVGRLIVPPIMEGVLDEDLSFGKFVHDLAPDMADRQYEPRRLLSSYRELVGHEEWPRRPALASELAHRHDTLINRWAGWVVPVEVAKAGEVLLEETVRGIPFRIEVVGPEPDEWTEFPVENQSLVLRVVYGEFSALLPSALQIAGQRKLADRLAAEGVHAQVLVVPHQGAALPGLDDRIPRSRMEAALARGLGPLLDAVHPEVALFEFGTPRPVLDRMGRAATLAHEVTRDYVAMKLGEDAIWGTDRDMAIIIRSDGQGYTIETQADRNRARGGEDEAVSDLSIGF